MSKKKIFDMGRSIPEITTFKATDTIDLNIYTKAGPSFMPEIWSKALVEKFSQPLFPWKTWRIGEPSASEIMKEMATEAEKLKNEGLSTEDIEKAMESFTRELTAPDKIKIKPKTLIFFSE